MPPLGQYGSKVFFLSEIQSPAKTVTQTAKNARIQAFYL